MSERSKHLFEFEADVIAEAAKKEASYHADRVAWWKEELHSATEKVRKTAKVEVREVPITGGYRPDVIVDYGDPAAYRRMQEASAKIQNHQAFHDRFRSDAELYGTQADRIYQLDGDDVAHFRLNGRKREE